MSEKKKKKTSAKLNRWLFLALWIFSHAFAWGATYGLAESVNPNGDWQLFLAFTLILGIVPGALLSVPQKWFMQRGLGLNIQWWRRVSIATWGLGGVLLWAMISFFSNNYPYIDPPIGLIIGTWFGPLVLAQYFLMRQHIQRASLFALANLTSVIVFTQFVGLYEDVHWLRFVISGTLQGAVTGLTLLWLYGMAQQEKSKHIQEQDEASNERLLDTLEDDKYQIEDGTQSASSASLQ